MSTPRDSIATRFPHQAAGLDIWIGGRDAAESQAFIKANNIKFVISAVGVHTPAFNYPVEAGDDFKTFNLPVGYEGEGRDQCSELFLQNTSDLCTCNTSKWDYNGLQHPK